MCFALDCTCVYFMFYLYLHAIVPWALPLQDPLHHMSDHVLCVLLYLCVHYVSQKKLLYHCKMQYTHSLDSDPVQEAQNFFYNHVPIHSNFLGCFAGVF
jgi:hypothetical protein